MRFLLLVLWVLPFAGESFAQSQDDDLLAVLHGAYPSGGYSISDGIPAFHPDFFQHGYTQPAAAEIDALVADYQSLGKVQARRLAETKKKARSLYNEYALDFAEAEVIAYGAALRDAAAKAAADIGVLPDAASVKNYQPAWPAKPNL